MAESTDVSEIAKAWNTKGGIDARDRRDQDIIKNTTEVKPQQPQPESSRMADVSISDEVREKTHKDVEKLGKQAAEYFRSDKARKDIELAKAQEKGRIAILRTKLKHLSGK